ncbi:MAG: hypothetical protein ACKOQS_18355 [Dolichospermum sp.]
MNNKYYLLCLIFQISSHGSIDISAELIQWPKVWEKEQDLGKSLVNSHLNFVENHEQYFC